MSHFVLSGQGLGRGGGTRKSSTGGWWSEGHGTVSATRTGRLLLCPGSDLPASKGGHQLLRTALRLITRNLCFSVAALTTWVTAQIL